MLATTFGATHNIIIDEQLTSNFLKEEREKFSDLNSFKKVFYNKDTMVGDTSLNYLNMLCDSSVDESLKNIVLKEYYDCEKIYPYLGDYFLNMLFGVKLKRSTFNRFSKRDELEFIERIRSRHVKSIATWIFNNTNLKRSINIEMYTGKDIAVEMLDDFIFSCSYDFDFFTKLQDPLKKYRFVIINGMIESVGEIHHLLHKAHEKKEPYVIFCYGMSEEVKQTIIKNNNMGRLRVYPVVLDSNDELTLNILNDFAVIQGGNVVSSDLGQTISQEVSKDLKIAREIKFLPGKIMVKPNVCEAVLDSHKKFLIKRIDEAHLKLDVKLEPLQNRLKAFTSSRLNIYLPGILKKDKKLIRELDYALRFMSNISKNQTRVFIKEEMFYIPTDYINISKEKLKSLLEKFSNIHCFIV